MQLVISQELLSAALSSVSKAVSTRNINPVLNHLRMVVEADSLTLTATDGEFTIRRSIAISGAEPGRTLVPARLLAELVNRLPKKEITLKLAGSQMHLSVGRSAYDITVMGDENFPELPDFTEKRIMALPCAMLRRALEQTVFAALKDSSTGAVHYTNGVLFSFKSGRLDVVATDGHRLSLKHNDGLSLENFERDLLIPARVADELQRILPTDEESAVQLYYLGNQVFFAFDNLLLVSSLLDVKFPDYERVIPKDVDSKVHAGREELSEALARVLLVCRQKDHNPVAHLETAGETLRVTSDGGELGKGQEELGIELAGADIKIALNPAYLIDVFKVLGGEQITINWTNEFSPVKITSPRDPDFLYILMPIRMD